MKPAKIFDLSEKINQALKNPDFPNLAKIEYDLLLQNIRAFYEEAILLQNAPANELTKQAGNTGLQSGPEIPVAKKTLHSNKSLLLDEPAIEKLEVPTVKEKPAVTKQEVTLARPVNSAMKNDKTATINDSATLSGSLNEKLKTSSATEVHKKLATKPLKDLIDLNKRFVLLNELFKSNAEAFSAAIAHIDSLEDYSTALTFIQSQLVSNYFWDESSQSARLFMKLVRQKFGQE